MAAALCVSVLVLLLLHLFDNFWRALSVVVLFLLHLAENLWRALFRALFEAILLLLHLTDNVWRALFRVVVLVRKHVDGVLVGAEGAEDIIRRARHGAAPLRHLAFILCGMNETAVGDVIKLVVWAGAAGATHVSLYDPWGRHKARPWRAALDEALTRESLTPSRTPGSGASGGLGGALGPSVTLLDIADGKVAFARVVRDLCQDVLDGDLASADVTMEQLDRRVVRAAALPEPELAVYLGEDLTPCGLLPWHLRYTSFLSLPNVSLRAFVHVLMLYGACKQRRGA